MTHSWPLFFLKPGQLWFIVHFTVGPFISFLENMVLYFHFTFILFNIQGKVIFSNQKKKTRARCELEFIEYLAMARGF